jgi:8-oxo-dGTP pyrophosphatase MutT (NUDIX family)
VAEGFVREIKEETGLEVADVGPLVAVIQLLTAEHAPDSVTFVFEPAKWTGELAPHDPDRTTKRASFVPVQEAADRLTKLPWGLSDPAVHRLRGGPPGGVWTYSWDGAGPWEGTGGPAQLVTGPAWIE